LYTWRRHGFNTHNLLSAQRTTGRATTAQCSAHALTPAFILTQLTL
jgi:hypothetical protein